MTRPLSLRNCRLLAAVLVIAALALVVPVMANTVTISPSGGDDSSAITAAMTSAGSDGMVILNPGTYYAHDITVPNNIIITAADTHGPSDTIIDAAVLGRIFSATSRTVTIRNLGLRNGYAPAAGGAIYATDSTVTVTGSAITNCSAYNNGGAIFATSGSTVIIAGSTISDCSALWGGALYAYTSTAMTVTSTSITGCTAKNGGSAVFANTGSTVNVHYSRIFGNDGYSVYNNGATSVNVAENWWGTNSGPASSALSGTMTSTPYLVLGITANPLSVQTGGTSAITANLKYDSTGADKSGSGTVPDGIPVTFETTSGSVSPASATTVSGAAGTTFTPSSAGTTTVSSTVDGQTVTVKITVTAAPVDHSVTKVTGPGQSIQAAIDITNDGGTVIIYPGTYTQHDISVTKNIRIRAADGHGPLDTIIDAQSAGRIFTVTNSYSLAIDKLTLMNGKAPSDSRGLSMGGAIGGLDSNIPYSVTVTSSSFIGCSADNNGGAISADSSTVMSSTFTGCSAGNNGGAIYGDWLTVMSNTFNGCSAGNNGDAIYGDWTSNGPPATGTGDRVITALAVSPDGFNLYAGNMNGFVYSFTFLAPAPVAEFTGSPATGSYPLKVQFNDTSANSPTMWNWSYGDGTWFNTTDSFQRNASHTYTSAGSFTVNLIAGNTAGSNRVSKTGFVTVTAPAGAPVAGFSGIPTTGTVPLKVQFNDTSANSPTMWNWSYGDGTWFNTTDSFQRNASHTYTSAGSFTVDLTATNSAGSNSKKITNYITVNAAVSAPQSAFSANTTSGTVPLAVMFHDDSTNEPTEWLWDFGDGGTSDNQDILHIYTTAGNYTVNLTVKNAAGTSSHRVEKFITAGESVLPWPTPGTTPAPVAAFTANRTEGDRPLAVKFTDTSTKTPTSWTWDFGDSGTSTLQNPVHQYTTSGNYTVSLKAANAAGSSTATKTKYIRVLAPVVGQNTFAVDEVQTTITGSVQNVSVDTTGTNVTTSGNVVTIRNATGWSSVNITFAGTPETGASAVNGTVGSVMAVTEPVTAPIEAAGTPTVTISLNMSRMPGTTAAITQTITKDPDATAQSSFSLFASSEGKQINEIAYTLNIVKTNLENAGDGGIIQSATLTMTVSKAWVDAHGGVSSLAVLRRADDGTTQILAPVVTGPDADNTYTITVISPKGLSVFSLAAVSAVSTGSPGSTGSSYNNGDTDTGTFVSSQPKSTSLLAPVDPSSYPWTTQSIRGPTHITKIELQPIGTFKDLFILTEKPDSLPQGIPAPGVPVYEFHKITLYHATNDDINQAKIEFTVSPSYLESQKMTSRDVQLMRYRDKAWEKLPTEYEGMKDGEHLYRATTSGFSYFATVVVKDATIMTTTTTTTVPTLAGQVQTSQKPTATHVKSTVAPAVSRTQAAPPVTDTPKPAGVSIPFYIFGIAGIIILCISIVIVRRWYIRRQNPALFRKYD
nr:PKD domain-containing protein [uncultured Methanoregula sp.]